MKNFYEIVESIMVSFIIITLLILFVFRVVAVDGSSMNPTLNDKDRIITTNFMYKPKKGDVIIVDKNNALNKPLVKRVIATAGDTIKIDYTTGDVFINGEILNEKYINEKIAPRQEAQLEVTVKEGFIFVMGDNRNHSADSRDDRLGQVNVKNILGKALFRILPFDAIGGIK
ncbi:MAG: signal peptidase I [Oscillospiraceae bacterium]